MRGFRGDPGLPDDWGMYYRTCDVCGSRYHASEGGCSCYEELMDLEPCHCGQCNWVCSDERSRHAPISASVRCDTCGEKPGTWVNMTLDDHDHVEDYDPHCLWCHLPKEAKDLGFVRDNYNILSEVHFNIHHPNGIESRKLAHGKDGWA